MRSAGGGDPGCRGGVGAIHTHEILECDSSELPGLPGQELAGVFRDIGTALKHQLLCACECSGFPEAFTPMVPPTQIARGNCRGTAGVRPRPHPTCPQTKLRLWEVGPGAGQIPVCAAQLAGRKSGGVWDPWILCFHPGRNLYSGCAVHLVPSDLMVPARVFHGVQERTDPRVFALGVNLVVFNSVLRCQSRKRPREYAKKTCLWLWQSFVEHLLCGAIAVHKEGGASAPVALIPGRLQTCPKEERQTNKSQGRKRSMAVLQQMPVPG